MAWKFYTSAGMLKVYNTVSFMLGHLNDVTITDVAEDDRLVYDAVAGKWKNNGTIDGGSFSG